MGSKLAHRIILSLVLAGAFSLLGTGSARATTIYNLTSDHCTGGCGTPPFGSVTLDQNGSDVDVTVHLNSPNVFVKTSSADFMAFKFNATDVVLGDISVDQTVALQTLIAATGSFTGDGTGFFGFGIECSTCGGGASDKFSDDIVFHVANATIADLTVPNDKNNVFVADILSDPALGGNGNTGPVDAMFPVPEPGTDLLMGLGLLGLTLAGRRR
jgi:hypothetical protein